jgi:hypothetical protein
LTLSKNILNNTQHELHPSVMKNDILKILDLLNPPSTSSTYMSTILPPTVVDFTRKRRRITLEEEEEEKEKEKEEEEKEKEKEEDLSLEEQISTMHNSYHEAKHKSLESLLDTGIYLPIDPHNYASLKQISLFIINY